MSEYQQAERGLKIDTPLGPDALLLVGVSGHEFISRMFGFDLDLVAENRQPVLFQELLGKRVTIHIHMNDGTYRHVNGICVKVAQGDKNVLADDRKAFTAYSMEVVPEMWRMTRKARCRIFQHITIPDILKKVFGEYGFKVSYDIQGTFYERDYCVQYRETDFNFVSRLMEEEGIFYFFKHTTSDHELVVSNEPGSHPDVPGPSDIAYEQTANLILEEDRIYDWKKSQELKSGKVALWDHTFELPHKHLEVEKTTLDEVVVGSVHHVLALAENQKMEVYDWPGEYAQRFDGIDRSGGERPADIQRIFEERQRVIDIRMQQEETGAIVVRAGSNVPQMEAGHRFTLTRHFNANGRYVLYAVLHSASEMTYRSDGAAFEYQNRLVCLPDTLPFVPPLATPWPTAKGTQTAVVVGPSGEEIFTDKYGRVKVQFHWDREGKSNEDSSCWIRVASSWAGSQWGAVRIPRIGQEVVVAFEEGDPDKPIVVGSVYNAEMMPPYGLPQNKTQSGIVSRSSMKGGTANFNEIRFEDKKGEEEVLVHAEKNLTTEVEANESRTVGGDRMTSIGHDDTIDVENDRTATIGANETVEARSDVSITCGGSMTLTSGDGAATTELNAGGSVRIRGSGTLSISFGGSISIIGSNVSVSGGNVTVDAASISLNAATVTCAGVLSATTVTATIGVVSPCYSPGVGNLL